MLQFCTDFSDARDIIEIITYQNFERLNLKKNEMEYIYYQLRQLSIKLSKLTLWNIIMFYSVNVQCNIYTGVNAYITVMRQGILRYFFSYRYEGFRLLT